MCIEYAFKRGGISLIRNFMHQSEGIQRGLPQIVQNRLKFQYKLRSYGADGKVNDVRIITSLQEAFPAKGDKK